MVANRIQLLYVEDNLADLRLLQKKMQVVGETAFEMAHVFTLKEAQNQLQNQHYQLILLDLSLPDAHELEGVMFFRKHFPNVPIVVLTGNIDKQIGIDAIKIGAQDYLVKGDFSPELFQRVCKYAIERAKINLELKKALSEVGALNSELLETLDALKVEKKLVEQKNHQINSLVNLLVHDLKNPVIAITSLTALLLKEVHKLTIPQVKYLNQIKHSSNSILDNILTIIDTTQVNEGNLKLSMTTENPYYTLNSVIDKFIIEAIQKNIILEIKYNKALPHVLLDKRSFDTVLSSFLAYSIKNTIEDSRIVVSVEDELHRIKIILEVKGLSIKLADIQAFFDNAHQENEKHEQPQFVVDGYNLQLAKKLIEAMNGEILVAMPKSEKGILLGFTLQKAFSNN